MSPVRRIVSVLDGIGGDGFKSLALALSMVFAAPVAWATEDGSLRIVVFGDSLAAGYGLLPDEGFVAQLQGWAGETYEREIVIENAGVSGDTTAGGLARLDWALGGDAPDALVLELGANDALRGVDPAETRANLTAILEKLEAKSVDVLLAGMLAPRNMGADYIEEFEAIYPDLATRFDVVYLTFFLEGVAGEAALNQADGIHPNPEGVAVMVEHIAPSMQALIERATMD